MLKYAYGKYLGLVRSGFYTSFNWYFEFIFQKFTFDHSIVQVDYLHRTGLAKKCAGLRMGAKGL